MTPGIENADPADQSWCHLVSLSVDSNDDVHANGAADAEQT